MSMEVRERERDGGPTPTFISDAVDYKGAPANRSTTGGWLSAASIVVVELCERLSSMSIGANLVTYLTGTLHVSSATSSSIVSMWGGVSFLFSLFGGILADSFFGRYWTITFFATLHIAGSSLLAVSTVVPKLRPPPCSPALLEECIEANGHQMAVFYLAIYTVAIGLGGIKCSVSGFGADQFDESDVEEKTQKTYFFNRFYFFISIGTLAAVTVFIYLQENVARVWGYGSCTLIMLISLLIFLSATRRYRYKPRLGSPIVQILQVVVAAVRKRNLHFPPDKQHLYETHSQESRIMPTSQFSCLDKASIRDGDDDNIMMESGTANPWRLCSVTQVEEVRMMTRLLPIWATTIMFYVIYAQMITFAVLQAASMERTIRSFQIPAGSFNAFLIGAILLTLGVYDRLIVSVKGILGLTNLQKIGVGLLFSIIAIVVAAAVETRRLKVAKSTSGEVSVLPISAFLLVPQFVFAGAAEGLVYSGQIDFFLTESPKGMKAISTSLFLTTIAFGFFVNSAMIAVVRKATQGSHDWLPPNINNGRLDLFYGITAFMSLVNLAFYFYCQRWFLHKKSLTSLTNEASPP